MRKMRSSPFLWLVLAFLFIASADAQDDVQPEEFAVTATAVDGVNLLSNRYMIALWGIEPIELAGTSIALKARTELDNLIGGQPVRCEVKLWRGDKPVARCLNSREVDLGLAMITAGYAVVDRPAISGTVFDNQYKIAEKKSQDEMRGGWGSSSKSGDFAQYFSGNKTLLTGWLIGVVLIPLAGIIFLSLFVTAQINGLRRYIQSTIGESEMRKKDLREQERFVVASMIEGELSANKGKLEAFIIIYNDLLKSLRQSKEHRYQTNGEIVHDAPLLERNVFENNINRLELLGAAMAGEIVSLYGHIDSNPKYTTLDSSMPAEEAVLKLQKVIYDAESLIPRIDKLIQSLHVTVRDKQARQVKFSR